MVERKIWGPNRMINHDLTRKQLGALGEGFASEYLLQKDYRILDRNWRCRTGEIDLIALDNDLLVFVEVRTRSGSRSFGTPQESVNAKKQQQVSETAQFYMLRHHMLNRQVRFDVISILTAKHGELITLEHLPNAF
jgi:putative endonuclease